ncbi:MAG: hypothetical protein FWF83_02730 [Clostridiales bacterium]|nr:hypothetical protein [Clostridiales bacterium]
MTEYASGKRLGFHTPGHQGGLGMPSAFMKRLHAYGLALDLTELPGLDNLSDPSGRMEESQKALADLTGAKETYYMVNGSTGGLEAAMLAMSSPGAPTLMPSHCHMAIHSGLILTGSMPIILPCKVDPFWGLPLGLSPEVFPLVEYQTAKPDTPGGYHMGKALWVTVNPTYNGVFADLARERDLLRKHPGWSWLADEAHGAHLPFEGKETPRDALSMGAHVVVHSVHKMGVSLTQTGLLHCNDKGLSSRIRQAVNITQSSSPSYLLIASLEAWLAFLQDEGRTRLRYAKALGEETEARIRALGGYRIWRDEIPVAYSVDQRKITISSFEMGIDGYELARRLADPHGIDVELAAGKYVLLHINVGHEEKDIDRLIGALRAIRDDSTRIGGGESGHAGVGGTGDHAGVRGEGLAEALYPSTQEPWSPALTPREVFFAKRRQIALEDAPGLLSAATITPYPPGVPILFPGMVITKSKIEAIKDIKKAGHMCTGLILSEGRLCIEVVDG